MSIKTVDPITLKRWIESGEAVVIDVREPAEYGAENIQGAHLVPLATLTKATLPRVSGKKMVVHCGLGKRGAKACEKLLEEVPNLDVYNLEGGLSAWKAAGYQVICSGKSFLPLDQQVQLTIGILLVIGSLFGYFFSPMWFLLTGIIGLGLIRAGVTGSCGLTQLLAKMPWNQNMRCIKK